MHTFKIYLVLGTLIFSSVGCMAQPPKQPNLAASCPEVETFLDVIANKMLFDQSPEAFFTASTTILKAEKDVTQTGPNKMTSRNVTLVPISGSWLTKGSIAYDIENNKTHFDIAEFDISPSCFKSTHEFIELARKKIGKDGVYDKTSSPDLTESLFWRRKDPDINYWRFIEITASKDSYHVTANRDPSSEGAGG
jgi:hypothetical protein